MIDPLIPSDPGLLASVGKYLGRFGQVPLNLLSGNFGGALRQGADIIGDTVDAFLPGDLIPEFSRKEDEIHPADMIGLSRENDPFLSGAADFIGETLINPLTYLSGGTSVAAQTAGKAALKLGVPFTKAAVEIPGSAAALGMAGDAGKALYGALPAGVRDAAATAKLNTKSALGWLKPAMPEAQAAMDAASETKSLVNQAGQAEVQRILKGTTEQERQDVFDVMQNLGRSPKGIVGQLAPVQSTGFMTPEHQIEEFVRRSAMTGKDPAHIARINELAKQLIPYTHGQWAEGVAGRAFAPNKGVAEIPDATGQMVKTPWEINAEEMSPGMYAQRSWQDLAEAGAPAGGGMQATKARELRTGQDIADEMTFGGMARGTKLEGDIGTVAANRAGQQANLMSRAALGKSLLGDDFVSLTDQASRSKVSEIIDAMQGVDPEGALLLKSRWEGLPARGNLASALHSASRIFKPAAVAGVGVPRVGSIFKNVTGFPQQLAMSGEWKEAGKQILRTPATLYEAGKKTLEGYAPGLAAKLPSTELGKDGAVIEQALAAGGGRADNVLKHLDSMGRSDLADAMKYGAIDGFVSAEVAQNTIKNSGFVKDTLGKVGIGVAGKERIGDILDAPGKGFQAAEQAGRLGSFKSIREDLMSKGMKREEASRQAADRVTKGLYDYQTLTAGNRALRDALPFGQFMSQSIRQGGNFLAENPAAAVAAGHFLSRGSDDPVYDSMAGKANIPIGMDSTGHQSYITSLGLPLESLGNIPNPSADLPDFGRQIEQDIIGSSHPLLKSLYSLASNRDPYYGSDAGTYSKIAGQEAGGAGRLYNRLAGTGLVQPLVSPINQLGRLIDDKGSLPEDLLSLTTGANIVHVDEDQALRQKLEDRLKRNPDIRSYTSLYSESKDPRAEALLKALAEAKKRIKEKKARQGLDH